MENSLDKLTIKGYKSIKELTNFEMKNLNVFVGSNGSGKSNLISFFQMLRSLIDGNLNRFVNSNGGAGDILYKGRKITKKAEFVAMFGERGFRFNLVPTPKDVFSIEDEARYYEFASSKWWKLGDSPDGTSRMVSEVVEHSEDAIYSRPVFEAISSWQIYHFHDTSSTASMRHYEIVQDNKVLRRDASNIGAFLLKLKNEFPAQFKEIVNSIQLVAPFFNTFILDPIFKGDKEVVNISWTQKDTDYPMQPYHFSDGTLRFICLATALLQPHPPATIIIDEPELGLHPSAIAVLADLIQVGANRTQVIIATQSPTLLNYFNINDIVVVKQDNGASVFERLNHKDFSEWLKEYSVGELWEKNVIQGGPSYE